MPGFAPKLRVLTATETPSTLDTWRETLVFQLTLDGSFEEFLEDDFEWGEADALNRGFLPDDPKEVTENPRSAKQKAGYLKLMLGTISSYAPVISREFIVKEACSLDEIWNRLRIHYGFRKSGALILELASFSQEADESYESLWERLYSFVSDNLIQPLDGIMHCGKVCTQREVMTPTLLNMTVVHWLRTVNPALPALIKQKYSTELRNKSLASLREEISESLGSLLSELNGECANIARVPYSRGGQRNNYSNAGKPFTGKSRVTKFCPLCDACRRSAEHFLSECPFLPDADKRFMSSKARYRAIDVVEDLDEEFIEEVPKGKLQQINVSTPAGRCMCDERGELVGRGSKVSDKVPITGEVRKVDVVSSPYLWVKYGKFDVPLTIDSAAETDVMKLSFARSIGASISRSKVGAVNADGKTDLKTVGEVHMTFLWENHPLRFDGLVVEELSDNVLAGGPFMMMNDVYARPAKQQVYIGERSIPYKISIRSAKAVIPAVIMRVPRQRTLLPGESVKLDVPEAFLGEEDIAIEPRWDAQYVQKHHWLQPSIVQPEAGKVEVTNVSSDPILIRRHEQVATVRAVVEEQIVSSSSQPKDCPTYVKRQPAETRDYLDVGVDPDNILTQQQKEQFRVLHEKYKNVFDGRSLGCYNGTSGPLEVKINMGSTLPPQRKGRIPLYNRSLKEEYQQICDDLEGTVLLKPEEVGVTCEYLNPSFLIKKKSGKKRLVTAFTEVAQYSKPQPALMSNIEESLRQIANYEHLVKGDLSSAYWQMILSKDSMKYTGVATPYKGIRVYGRGAMGMPGTESALEEMMSRILGDQMKEGGVTKVADDLYCGGSTPEEALGEWEKVLKALEANGLRISASKTVVCPQSTVILGWLWCKGTIRASPHRISVLEAIDPESLSTVGQVRSFIGSYKYLSRVLKSHSDVLSPLDEVIAGRNKSEKILWTDSLIADFKRAQAHLQTEKTITLPRRDDHLRIITDASNTGIGAALYVVRKEKLLLAGHFNAKLKKHQVSWLPCELESLAVTAAVNHFSPELVNSNHQTLILTDSLPTVQAFQKMLRGQFSSSSRVSTFLTTLSRYNVHLTHIKGSENIYSDYMSRNAMECNQKRCQVCTFVEDTSDCVVRACTVKEVFDSACSAPFNSRGGWLEIQRSDDVLRRTHAHLKQGTKPSKKETNVGDVKRYLQLATRVGKDGLVVVEAHSPVRGRYEKIVVPKEFLHGLLECIHLKLNHPSKAELRKVFCRAFYAINLEPALNAVSQSCHQCLSLSDMPNKFLKQSSTTVPSNIGSHFSADVVKRSGQKILFLREYVSSYSQAKLIKDEKAQTVREALIIMSSELIPKTGPKAIVKVDPASTCRSLSGDTELQRNGIVLELGYPKYKNKNPVGERGIRELHSEINRVQEGGMITERNLSRAVASLNARLRREGLSSWEMWTHRCQFSGCQLPVDDLLLMKSKADMKSGSHEASAVYKARGKVTLQYSPIKRGDLVYINSDRSKLKQRERYIVTEVGEDSCKVQKFIGSQLRARPYVVNRADILVVQSWKFPVNTVCGEESQESSDEDDSRDSIESVIEVHGSDIPEPPDAEPTVATAVPGTECADKTTGRTTRSGRTVRLPSHLDQFVLD